MGIWLGPCGTYLKTSVGWIHDSNVLISTPCYDGFQSNRVHQCGGTESFLMRKNYVNWCACWERICHFLLTSCYLFKRRNDSRWMIAWRMMHTDCGMTGSYLCQLLIYCKRLKVPPVAYCRLTQKYSIAYKSCRIDKFSSTFLSTCLPWRVVFILLYIQFFL